MFNNKKGITLIALVITIIVLLILVGVSISALVSDDGLLEQSNYAVDMHRIQNAKEEIALAWVTCEEQYLREKTKNSKIKREDVFTKANLNKYLSSNGKIVGLTSKGNGKFEVVYKCDEIDDNYVFEVDKNRKITYLEDGVSPAQIADSETRNVEIENLGTVEVTTSEEEVDFSYNPSKNEVEAKTPDANITPEEPQEVEEVQNTRLINFTVGTTETNTQEEYQTVEYQEVTIRTKRPVEFGGRFVSTWRYSNGIYTSTNANLTNIEQKYSTYIAYQNELAPSRVEMGGVGSPCFEYYRIINNIDDTEENAIYLAAYLQNVLDKTMYVAKWNGTQYVKENLDSQIAGVTNFAEIITETKTKQIPVVVSSETTFVPISEYTAVEGMTWNEWLNSEYNTGHYSTDSTIYDSDGDIVQKTQAIANEGLYQIGSGTLCFAAGTSIYTENGMKNIEDIQVGEKVYTINLENNQRELKEVTRTIVNKTNEMLKIKVGDEIIKCTPRHQIYILDKGWVRAYDLEEGDILFGNENKVIEKIEHEYYEASDSKDVYNLTVEGNHNYLITDSYFLVHNLASPSEMHPANSPTAEGPAAGGGHSGGAYN